MPLVLPQENHLYAYDVRVKSSNCLFYSFHMLFFGSIFKILLKEYLLTFTTNLLYIFYKCSFKINFSFRTVLNLQKNCEDKKHRVPTYPTPGFPYD